MRNINGLIYEAKRLGIIDECTPNRGELLGNKEFMLSALEKSESRTKGRLFGCASDELRHDREFALACFSHCISMEALCAFEGDSIARYMVIPKVYPLEYLNDRELVSALICNLYGYDGHLRDVMSEELFEDREFFTAAFKERIKKGNSIEIYGLPDYILDDEEFARFCIDRQKSDLGSLGLVSDEGCLSGRLWDKEDFVEYAVLSNANNMRHASYRLHNDRDFILKLLKQGVKLSSRVLKDDEEIAKYVLAAYPEEYEYLSKRLRMKPEIALDALEKGCPVEKIDEDLYLDREFALKAVKINRDIYWKFPEETRNDAQITLNAYNNTFPYKKREWILYEVMDDDYGYYSSSNLRHDLKSVGPKLKADRDFTEKLVDAFLETEQSEGYTKEELMEDFPAFYERMDKMVWNDQSKELDEEYPGLKLDMYIED